LHTQQVDVEPATLLKSKTDAYFKISVKKDIKIQNSEGNIAAFLKIVIYDKPT